MTSVAVVVPTMRAQHAERFMRSISANSHHTVNVYAVCHADDCADAWLRAGATVVSTNHVGMPGKVNVGYQQTHEPWVFFTGEDVTFHDGWDAVALRVAESTGASVIGTNDLGNARVLAGQHATHMLFRRTYVEEHGGSFAPAGILMHEGYHHWYADDEIVAAAQQRGAWTPCLESVVEHLHPAFGKADGDAVYARGNEHQHEDLREFKRRVAQYGGRRA